MVIEKQKMLRQHMYIIEEVRLYFILTKLQQMKDIMLRWAPFWAKWSPIHALFSKLGVPINCKFFQIGLS